MYQKGAAAKVSLYDALPGTSYEILCRSETFSLHWNVQLDVKGMNLYMVKGKKEKKNYPRIIGDDFLIRSWRFDTGDRYCQNECEEDFPQVTASDLIINDHLFFIHFFLSVCSFNLLCYWQANVMYIANTAPLQPEDALWLWSIRISVPPPPLFFFFCITTPFQLKIKAVLVKSKVRSGGNLWSKRLHICTLELMWSYSGANTSTHKCYY